MYPKVMFIYSYKKAAKYFQKYYFIIFEKYNKIANITYLNIYLKKLH